MQSVAQGVDLLAEVTIYTIAKELNMTSSMVSRAFNPNARIAPEKRKMVLELAEKYGFSPNKHASRLSMKPINIGIILSSRFDVNTQKMTEGIKKAHSRLKDYKINYDISVIDKRKNTDKDYVDALEKYVNYDGIIVTGMSSPKCSEVLNCFYEKNKNIVQVQAVNENTKCLFSSKHNEETASALAAEFLSNCLRFSKRKNVFLFTGDRESRLHSKAANAFEKMCKSCGLNLVGCADMGDSEDKLSKFLPTFKSEYFDNVDGIYTTSGICESLCKFLECENDKPVFVSFDTHDVIKKYLENGIISATIAQNVSRQMEIAFENLAHYIIDFVECPDIVYTDVQIVMKSNMHQFD